MWHAPRQDSSGAAVPYKHADSSAITWTFAVGGRRGKATPSTTAGASTEITERPAFFTYLFTLHTFICVFFVFAKATSQKNMSFSTNMQKTPSKKNLLQKFFGKLYWPNKITGLEQLRTVFFKMASYVSFAIFL